MKYAYKLIIHRLNRKATAMVLYVKLLEEEVGDVVNEKIKREMKSKYLISESEKNRP